MSFDHVIDRFNELSVSPLKITPLKKKPLLIRSDLDEFLAFDSFKYSSRILLNYKDLSSMGLKAGSLVKIHQKGISTEFYYLINIFHYRKYI
jgi:hypothetical protein